MYIFGAKILEHCFNISRDILDWVLYCIIETTYDSASSLVHLPLDWVVQVWALAEDIVQFTLFSVPLSSQVYKWVMPSLMLGGGTLWWTNIPSRGK